jgi:hypothetical protein
VSRTESDERTKLLRRLKQPRGANAGAKIGSLLEKPIQRLSDLRALEFALSPPEWFRSSMPSIPRLSFSVAA